MRAYKLTKLGSRIAKTKEGNSEELHVLQFIQERGTATSDELESIGGNALMRRLVRDGLVIKLTTD